MKINLDDPNLTAYALGELPTTDRVEMEAAVAQSVEAQEFVRQTREVASLLRGEFAAELKRAQRKPLSILPLPSERTFWSDARWMSIGLAALLAVAAVIAAVSFSNYELSPQAQSTHRALTPKATAGEVLMEIEATPAGPLLAENNPKPEIVEEQPAAAPPAPMEANAAGKGKVASNAYAAFASAHREPTDDAGSSPPFNTAEYEHFEENPFLAAASNPLSTFSIDVDTASYANVRRMLNAGTKPPKDAVRIEEMVNYFTYDYPRPTGRDPFSINLEVAGCPWAPEHRLVRIGLKGREIASDKRGASNLVFLLDVSGSMDPADRLPLVKQALRLLVDKLTENDRVAIVVYAGGSGLVLPYATGDHKEQILQALENLHVAGSTNGAAGIELAYQVAAENFIKGGVNRVLLATDGDFNVGLTSEGELVRLAQEKAQGGVFLTVLGVGNDNLKDSTMQKIADKANGNYAYLDSLEEARKVLVQQMNGTLVTIAKDVKVQVEFNPARVASYRLLGYEKRMLRKEDFNNEKIDAGEIGAGHAATALYEVVPRGAANDPSASVPPVDALKYSSPDRMAVTSSYANPSPDLLTVKLRYKQPDGDKSELLERSLAESGKTFAQASPDFRFAAAVAEFGMILRGSPHRGDATIASVVHWAGDARGSDANGYRAGFLDLAHKAQALAY
ncbi:MAG: YfbK domain-containing protein [Chthoniobacterales bacterium]